MISTETTTGAVRSERNMPIPEETTRETESVRLANRIREQLNANLDCHVTIRDLAEQFHVSQTQLKCSFKQTYGVSIYSYSRAQKMKDAARLLSESRYTVLEVAGKYGYSNGSKFAKAFRDVMGMSPKEYRSFIRQTKSTGTEE